MSSFQIFSIFTLTWIDIRKICENELKSENMASHDKCATSHANIKALQFIVDCHVKRVVLGANSSSPYGANTRLALLSVREYNAV